MKIYLAATYDSMMEMRHWRDRLVAAGHTVTSRWIDGAEENGDLTPAQCAQMDLDDIDAADALVSKTLSRGVKFTGGGRHIEFGYALARDKLLLNIGGIESVFHQLPQVFSVDNLDAAITKLNLIETANNNADS